jgi:hypothetical protein
MLKPVLRLNTLKKTPIGTLIMTETTSDSSDIRRLLNDIKGHEGRREKGHEHE